MSSDRLTCGKRLVATAALAAFVLMAMGTSCKGFFVNQPNSVTVTTTTGGTSFSAAPTANLKAVASFDSGNKDVTNSASWQSSGCATVSTTGVVTATGTASSVTISATVAGVSGSITGSTSVSGGTTQTLTISPTLATLSNGTVQFQALDSNSVDQAANATWTSSNTAVLSFASSTGGLATLSSAGTATVSASASSGSTCSTGSASVTVQ
jgi:trimeric autotransporter adhesin